MRIDKISEMFHVGKLVFPLRSPKYLENVPMSFIELAVVSIVLRLINVLRDGERCRGTVRVSDNKETAAEVYVMRLRCVRDRSNRSISIYNSVRCRSNVWRGLGTVDEE